MHNTINAAHKLLSFKEVQRHCTAPSCWIVIDNQVYDITQFLEEVSTLSDQVSTSGMMVSQRWVESEQRWLTKTISNPLLGPEDCFIDLLHMNSVTVNSL